LAKALLENRSLKYLELDTNNIGNRGGTAIAGLLENNSQLNFLSLGNMRNVRKIAENNIDGDCINWFCRALKKNENLNSLILSILLI